VTKQSNFPSNEADAAKASPYLPHQRAAADFPLTFLFSSVKVYHIFLPGVNP